MRRSHLVFLLLLLSCTNVSLYAAGGESRAIPDRVSLSGTFCNDLPSLKDFPVKVVYIVDTSSEVRTRSADIFQLMQTSAEAVFQEAALRAESLAWISMGAQPRNLTPTGFARGVDLVPVTGGLTADLTGSGPERDFAGAFSLARALIADDLARTSAGQRQRTRYVVALYTSGGAQPGLDSTGRVLLQQTLADIAQLVDTHGAGELSFQLTYWAPAGGGLSDATGAFLTNLVAGVGGSVALAQPSGFNFATVDARPMTKRFVFKQLLVWNRNALATKDGMVPDSDGDGLSDGLEAEQGTDPFSRDTDQDGISDSIEARLTPSGRDPLHEDVTLNCNDPTLDSDGDGLTNCEEALLGTDASLPDTDGDGLPDLLELHAGTDYLHRDDLDDNDSDGASNAQEVIIHSDPWTTDLTLQSERGYRYRETTSIDGAGRECVTASVANVGVFEGAGGLNEIYVWMILAPEGTPEAPGLAKLATIPVTVSAGKRDPPDAVLSVLNGELMLLP